MSWRRPSDVGGRPYRPQRINALRAVERAETALRNGRPGEAIGALSEVDTTKATYPRTLLIEALTEAGDFAGLCDALRNPLTLEESGLLIAALIETQEFDTAQTHLSAVPTLDAGTRSALQDRLTARRMLRQK